MLPERLLGLLDDDPPERSPEDRLVRVRTEVEPETPQRFLSHGAGAPRAFWGLDGSWQAAIGEAAAIRIPVDRNGHDRFEAVREQSARLARDRLLVDETGTPLRFVGGFAFHPAPQPDPMWDGFDAARFAVPALELEHTASHTHLVGTARVPPDTDPGAALEDAQAALERAADELACPPPRGPTEYTIPTVADTTDRQAWSRAVDEALGRIRDGQLRKVVLARTLDLDAGTPPDPTVVLANLRQGNPGTGTFLMEPAPGHAFVGAAPELVASAHGTTFEASAVAGSIRRGDTEDEDDRLARTLAGSRKDRDEHAIVVRSMRDRLAHLTDHVEIGRDTTILRLSRIQHLERDLYARIREDQHVLELLAELHPTPAVCGHPRKAALALLRTAEPFERGWYAGPVGWFDTTGDGTFAPALRSAVLQDATWRLFAGAGIVEGSTPDGEWKETGIKFRPILDALGVQEDPP